MIESIRERDARSGVAAKGKGAGYKWGIRKEAKPSQPTTNADFQGTEERKEGAFGRGAGKRDK